jgi:hypothetical protein
MNADTDRRAARVTTDGTPVYGRPCGRPFRLREGNEQSRAACSPYNPNTYSIDAVALFFNSGAFCNTKNGCFEPTSTAMYCLPLTE